MSRTVRLANGREMPVIGIGVYQIPNGLETRRTVLTALESGYRLIDTAALYGNESSVGDAVRECGIDRNEIFITTKLFPFRITGVKNAFYASLKRLGVGYIDLYLIHWPFLRRRAVWNEFEDLLATGDVCSIGVSNFRIADIEMLKGARPTVNQVEFHPFLFRKRLLEYSRANNIVLEAHTPLLHGKRLNDERLTKVAAEYNKSVAQILLRWSIQHGLVAIPKATQREQIQENIRVFDFDLSDASMAELDALNENHHIAGLSRIIGDPA